MIVFNLFSWMADVGSNLVAVKVLLLQNIFHNFTAWNHKLFFCWTIFFKKILFKVLFCFWSVFNGTVYM